jgi:hypothetical protein
MSDEAGEMASVLCGLFDMVNQRIAKEYKGQSIPNGGWKVLKQDVTPHRVGWQLIVMRRDDGKKFRITVEDA